MDFGWLLGLALFVIALPVLAGDGPPARYNLGDVTIVLEHEYSDGYSDSITIRGDGSARYNGQDQRENRTATFKLPAGLVRQTLRNLYSMRYFDLKDLYVEKCVVNFGDDDSVTTESVSTNQWNVTLSVQIGDYRKSVRFDRDGAVPLVVPA